MTHQVESGDPLQNAHRMQVRVSRVGFDWAEPMGAWRKVAEELEEVRVELEALARVIDESEAGGDEAAGDAKAGGGADASDYAGPGSDERAGGHEKVSSDPRPGSDPVAIRRRLGEELGDLLFSVVNLARLAGDHAHPLLEAANRKFADRFRRLEALAEERGVSVGEASLDLLDALWDELKAEEELGVQTPGGKPGREDDGRRDPQGGNIGRPDARQRPGEEERRED